MNTAADDLIAAGKGRGTNPVCSNYIHSFDGCGCENCGHLKDEHDDAFERVDYRFVKRRS